MGKCVVYWGEEWVFASIWVKTENVWHTIAQKSVDRFHNFRVGSCPIRGGVQIVKTAIQITSYYEVMWENIWYGGKKLDKELLVIMVRDLNIWQN